MNPVMAQCAQFQQTPQRFTLQSMEWFTRPLFSIIHQVSFSLCSANTIKHRVIHSHSRSTFACHEGTHDADFGSTEASHTHMLRRERFGVINIGGRSAVGGLYSRCYCRMCSGTASSAACVKRELKSPYCAKGLQFSDSSKNNVPHTF